MGGRTRFAPPIIRGEFYEQYDKKQKQRQRKTTKESILEKVVDDLKKERSSEILEERRIFS